MSPKPYEFYDDGTWQYFAESITPLIDAAVASGEVWEVELMAKKPKSQRVLRRKRVVAPDGTPIDWRLDGSRRELPARDAMQFFHCKAAFFKRMRALHRDA